VITPLALPGIDRAPTIVGDGAAADALRARAAASPVRQRSRASDALDGPAELALVVAGGIASSPIALGPLLDDPLLGPAVLVRRRLVGTVDPTGRAATRLVGIHLVGLGPPGGLDAPAGLPRLVELVVRPTLDPALDERWMSTVEDLGLPCVVVGDGPGRVVDRLDAVVRLERELVRMRASGSGALSPWLDRPLDAPARALIGTIAEGLGRPERFEPGPPTPTRDRLRDDQAPEGDRIALAVVAEAYRIVEEGVADPTAVDRAVELGLGWPTGPFALAGGLGLREVVARLSAASRAPGADRSTVERFSVPGLLWRIATA
jgi:hypothetical protein